MELPDGRNTTNSINSETWGGYSPLPDPSCRGLLGSGSLILRSHFGSSVRDSTPLAMEPYGPAAKAAPAPCGPYGPTATAAPAPAAPTADGCSGAGGSGDGGSGVGGSGDGYGDGGSGAGGSGSGAGSGKGDDGFGKGTKGKKGKGKGKDEYYYYVPPISEAKVIQVLTAVKTLRTQLEGMREELDTMIETAYTSENSLQAMIWGPQ